MTGAGLIIKACESFFIGVGEKKKFFNERFIKFEKKRKFAKICENKKK